jgi:hypothetical protein
VGSYVISQTSLPGNVQTHGLDALGSQTTKHQRAQWAKLKCYVLSDKEFLI